MALALVAGGSAQCHLNPCWQCLIRMPVAVRANWQSHPE